MKSVKYKYVNRLRKGMKMNFLFCSGSRQDIGCYKGALEKEDTGGGLCPAKTTQSKKARTKNYIR